VKKYRPARLHVIVAREAPVAIVIRRGPSKEVACFQWNMETDEFRLGQWLKGRIYERCSDLSPDGRYFLYCGVNGLWDVAGHGTWLAVSKAPYLKALDLYNGSSKRPVGGEFIDKDKYLIHDKEVPVGVLKKESDLVCVGSDCNGHSEVTGKDIYHMRLVREGWNASSTKGENPCDVATYDKSLVNDWVVRKQIHAEPVNGSGVHTWEEHRLVQHSKVNETPLNNCDWADKDKDTLVWARYGRIYRAKINDRGIGKSRIICDFNRYEYRITSAPY